MQPTPRRAAAVYARRQLTVLVAALIAVCVTVPAVAAAHHALSTANPPLVLITQAAAPAPAASPRPANCNPEPTTPVPLMVALIFRCRLTGVLAPDEVPQAVAEAEVVADCESDFDADVVVFAGRYVTHPHPRTGYRYTAAGVFQFIDSTAAQWVAGGYANVTDPIANITAAVGLYLNQRQNGLRGWEPWECAAVNGSFAKHSVLPGWPGGPARMPEWAYLL